MKKIRGIIISPVETYRSILSAEEKLSIPFVIVVISGLVEGLFSFLQSEACSFGIEIMRGIIAAILAWTGIAGILHLILKASGREGSYKRLLEFYPINTVISIFFGALFAYSAPYYLITKRRA